MSLLRIAAFLGLTTLFATAAGAEELNVWPFWVGQKSTTTGQTESWQAIGPLFFSKPQNNAVTWSGFRPLSVQKSDAAGKVAEYYFLYPLFTYRTYASDYRWSILNLINRDTRSGGGQGERDGFDLFPFYFSRNTGNPATSYHAVFPIGGTVYNRFSNEKLTWVLFPLYSRTVNQGVVVTESPWPFIKTVQGGGQSGFAFWPLFGWRDKPGAFSKRYVLWFLYYKNEEEIEDVGHQEQFGMLPFYARETRPGLKSETYLWPFFGYTDGTSPKRYHETRYFWPFFVQGRGDDVYRNRWAPLYTHSVVGGYDKTWVLWPLWRHARWTDSGLDQSKDQLLWRIFTMEVQRSATNPALAPASKTNLWPLFSSWNNGAGRRQFQLLSPFESFLPHNEPMRMIYTPLFALYRYDQPAPGDVRHSVLFDFITYHHTPAVSEFHLGPLLGVENRPDQGRIALGNGLVGLRRSGPDGGWKFFWFDFSSRQKQTPAPISSP